LGLCVALLQSSLLFLPSFSPAQPHLQPLLQGKWPKETRGTGYDVKMVGDYAYLALGEGGLAVIDVSSPAHCVRVGGYNTSGNAEDVVVSGDFAYVADGPAGLQVVNVTNPAAPVWVHRFRTSADALGVAASGGWAYVTNAEAGLQVIVVSGPAAPVSVGVYDTGGTAYGIAVANTRIYVANYEKGLVVRCSLPSVQAMLRVIDATTGVPCVIESCPALGPGALWTPLYTNASPSGPFEFTDFDVNLSQRPRKFYRARQP
jgi:hypothetical protein